MTVDLATIERALARAMAHLRARGVESVKIDDDDYWDFLERDRFDINRDPDKMSFGLGKLSEDWEAIQKIADDDSYTIGYALVWAAALLRAIGERNVG